MDINTHIYTYTYQCRYRYWFRYRFIASFFFLLYSRHLDLRWKNQSNFILISKQQKGHFGSRGGELFVAVPDVTAAAPELGHGSLLALFTNNNAQLYLQFWNFAKPQNLPLYTLRSTFWAPKTSFCVSRHLNNYLVWFTEFLYASWFFSETGQAKDYSWENIH